MTHVREPNSQAAIKSMDGVRHDIDNSNLPQFTGENLPEYMCFSYSRAYLSYETDKVNINLFSSFKSKNKFCHSFLHFLSQVGYPSWCRVLAMVKL